MTRRMTPPFATLTGRRGIRFREASVELLDPGGDDEQVRRDVRQGLMQLRSDADRADPQRRLAVVPDPAPPVLVDAGKATGVVRATDVPSPVAHLCVGVAA